MNSNLSRTYKFKETSGGKDIIEVSIESIDGTYAVKVKQIDGTIHEYKSCTIADAGSKLVSTIDGQRITSSVVRVQDKLSIFFDGAKKDVYIATPSYAVSEGVKEGSVITPMPCKISDVKVKNGDLVKKGQTLFILEAMKMEHVIKSPVDGIVAKVNYKVGDLVAEGKRLLVFAESATK